MKTYRYTLEPYKGPSTRYTCPQCGLKQVFVRYIDTQTHQHLADDIGRCNRETKCGYHRKPNTTSEYLNPNIRNQASSIKYPISSIQHQVSKIPKHIFHESLGDYTNNHLVRYLNSRLGPQLATDVVLRYHVGTHHHWDCSTVFWQVDEQGAIRTGKVMLYAPDSGRRIKTPYNHIAWVHKLLRYEQYDLQQCFFGQHLLRRYPTHTVAMVESEKTALIAAAQLPQYIWLAAGSLSNLSAQRCNAALNGRRLILYPDLGAYDKWLALSRNIANCSVSTLLEEHATDADRAQGLDVGDYLLR